MTSDMIELERKRLKIPVAKLCLTAGISTRAYERIRAGSRKPRGDTLAKLQAALARLGRGESERPLVGRAAVARALFRMLVVLLARDAGIDPKAALDHKPQRKATASDEWVEISRLRDVACYMLNTMAGMRNADVAAAAGVTPPAITNALRKVEDKRELHPELEAIFSMFEAAVR